MYSLVKYVLYNYFYAIKGYFVWRYILKKSPRKQRNDNKTKFVLLDTKDKIVLYYALAYLDKAMLFHQLTSAVIIMTADVNKRLIELFVDSDFSIVYIDEVQYRNLIKFYDLYEFDYRFVCTSLDDCEGRKSRIILGKNNINLEDLISIGIYKLKFKCNPKNVEYHGSDKDIKEFFSYLRMKGICGYIK